MQEGSLGAWQAQDPPLGLESLLPGAGQQWGSTGVGAAVHTPVHTHHHALLGRPLPFIDEAPSVDSSEGGREV